MNHPVASYIQSVDLAANKFVLLLANVSYGKNFYGGDEEAVVEEDDVKMIPVELMINLPLYANIERLHKLKKDAQQRCEKTETAAKQVLQKAMIVAEREKAKRELTVETRPAISKLRKTYWFEKFYWFISSDGFLVIAGRDAQQNEILYRKYLHKVTNVSLGV